MLYGCYILRPPFLSTLAHFVSSPLFPHVRFWLLLPDFLLVFVRMLRLQILLPVFLVFLDAVASPALSSLPPSFPLAASLATS